MRYVLPLLLAALAMAPAGAQQAAPTPRPSQQPVARIPAAAVDRLVEVGAERTTAPFFGIHRHDGETRMVSITSARQNIAYTAGTVAAKGGKYVPPPAARLDIVSVECGDEDIGERWDCTRIAVTNAAGQRVPPLSYSAGPRTFKNALGTVWRATLASATYRMSDLAKGFAVRYADGDGAEFTETVSASSVANVLLAELPPTKAMRDATEAAAAATATAALAAEPEPPPLFRGSLEQVEGDKWKVTSSTPGFVWRACALVSGSASATLPALEPGVSVTMTRPPGGLTRVRPVVHCTAKGRKFEGPVPAEFEISVERKSAEMWVVTNLTTWAWSNCEADVAGKIAHASAFMPGAVATFTAGDFSPGPPSAAAAPTAEYLKFSCATNGIRVAAVPKARQ